MATEAITVSEVQSLRVTGPEYPDPDWSHTTLNYYRDAEAAPPDFDNSTLSEHELRQARRGDDGPNVIKIPTSIRNIAGHEAEYNIATHGFCIGHLDSKMRHWRDDEELKQIYFPEVTELLKRETGAKYVFQYEWHVRSGTLEEALKADSTGATDINGPVRRVHIDESPASARREFKYWYDPSKPENEYLAGRKFGIYNVWKPIRTIRKDPLCLIDARSLEDEDLQSGKVQVPGTGEIENYAIRPPKEKGRHGFQYVRGQRCDQALVFRIYDGRVDDEECGSWKRCHGVAHTSFVDPGTECEAPRESVEVRSFCVF